MIETIIKKIRKELRLNAPISKSDVVLVTDDLTEAILKDIIRGMNVQIIKKNFVCDENLFENKKLKEFVKRNKVTKIFIPWTADDEIEYFINGFIRNKNDLKYLGHHGKFVKLFNSIFNNEVEELAKSKKMIYKIKKRDEFVEKVAKKYNFAKFGLLNSIQQIKRLAK